MTFPTIALTYIIANNLENKRIISLPMIILYYLYIASTYNLIMAGTSDPGIFERKYVYLLDFLKKYSNLYIFLS